MKNLLFVASADSSVCRVALQQILPIFEDLYSVHFEFCANVNFDLAIFFAPQSQASIVKSINPNCYVIILDPKLNNQKDFDEISCSDLALVSSVEQQIVAERYCPNVHIYNWFPFVDKVDLPKHHPDAPVVIAYQGNQVHLNSMGHSISPVLSRLSSNGYNIRFKAIYDIKNLGLWSHNLPSIPIDHIQWDELTYINNLADADIGIVPNLLPMGANRSRRFTWTNPFGFRLYNYNKQDYI